MIKKTRSVVVSERVMDLVLDNLNNDIELGLQIDGWLDAFINGREQGFALTICSKLFDNPDKTNVYLKVWVCEARSSDNILVVIGRNTLAEVYGEEEYAYREEFYPDEMQKSAKYIVEEIKKTFKNEYKKYLVRR